ncbi:hypothetical protein DFA_05569 [Cavenderia fasciculata]|uniref:Uncharacterized protein n=1 Tax=Cavenderia fasciculata TaxID=261658 RepID=F4PLL5_CACFS|nr:uncharacterized protein DFA_05569 [Cavenderia fasciculata]EGG23437.1 hypothetical protein DFA_05569 [Cavenderia fasciculata]|eukprot:XP_004361288.1 hypothetical protein DFA_05569 [Cavenderia fasciculata]
MSLADLNQQSVGYIIVAITQVSIILAEPGLYGLGVPSVNWSNPSDTYFGVFNNGSFNQILDLSNGEYNGFANGSDPSCSVNNMFYVFVMQGYGINELIQIDTDKVTYSQVASNVLSEQTIESLYCVGSGPSSSALPLFIAVQSPPNSNTGILISSNNAGTGGDKVLYKSNPNRQLLASAYDSTAGIVYIFYNNTATNTNGVTVYSMVAGQSQDSVMPRLPANFVILDTVYSPFDNNIYGIASIDAAQQTYRFFVFNPQGGIGINIIKASYTLPQVGSLGTPNIKLDVSGPNVYAALTLTLSGLRYDTIILDFDLETYQITDSSNSYNICAFSAVNA